MPREIQTPSLDEESALARIRKAIAEKLALAGTAALTSGMATVVAHSLLAIASPTSFSDAALTQFLSSLSANWLSQIVWELRGRMEKTTLTQANEPEAIRQLSGDLIQQLSDRDLGKVLARLGVIESTLRAAEAARVDVGALTREMLLAGIATKEDINATVAQIRPSQTAYTQVNNATNSTIITIAGDHSTVIVHETEAQRREYAILQDIKTHRAQIVARHSPLDLRGFDIAAQVTAASGSLKFGLEDVYTPLFTRRPADPRTGESARIRRTGITEEPSKSIELFGIERPDLIPIVEALNDAPRAVILGKGGSGKSAVLKHVALGLCGAVDDFEREWRHGALLSIWVTMREFVDYAHARSIRVCENAEQEKVREKFNESLRDNPAQALIDFVIDDLKRVDEGRKQALPILAQNLEAWLSERGGVFLLDGLDEVPSAQRLMVRTAIVGLAERFPRCRHIVACRPYSYRDAQNPALDRALKIAPRGKPLVELDVLPLGMPQIAFFVGKWYAQLAHLVPDLLPETATRRAEELVAQIDHDERLRVLADTPLLLTLIGSLHGLGNRRLPNERWELLKQTVELLLVSWQRRKRRPDDYLSVFDAAEIRIHEALDLQRGAALLTKLCQLAYDVHAGATTLNQSAASDITERQLMAALRDVLPRKVEATDIELAQYLRDRAGLILDDGGKDGKEHVYRFPHRMFQEYLAARRMVNSYGKVAAMIDGDYERWQEIYALIALMSENAVFTMTCVKKLCPQPPVSSDDWRRVELAVGIWADFPPLTLAPVLQDADHDVTQHIEEILAWLQARMSDIRGAPAPERAHIGDMLARLGDPRFDREHRFLPKDEWLGFVRIEADPGFRIGTRTRDFYRLMSVMGSDADRDEANDALTPTNTFYIAKYPVTVAQFRAFVDSTGLKVGHKGALHEPGNRPVRGVSWREALAYCAWLDTQLRGDAAPTPLRDLLRSDQWRVTLPSELEWEKAARGGLTDSVFSWNDREVNQGMANFRDSGVGTTCSVGCFPANGYGLYDMIGNVWEWTRSEYKPYPYDVAADLAAPDLASNERRVVRGGAFSHYRGLARCGYRGWDLPDHDYEYYGLRVVLSPSS